MGALYRPSRFPSTKYYVRLCDSVQANRVPYAQAPLPRLAYVR